MPNTLGYSQYLSTFNEQIDKLSPSKEGESLVFVSLHMPEEMDHGYADRCKAMLEKLRNLGFRIIADVSKRSLKAFGAEDLEELRELLQLDIIRIDFGFSEEEIRSFAKKYPVGINASLITEESVKILFEDAVEVYAIHNFYPRPETGLDSEQFEKLNAMLKAKHIKVAAFIPGDRFLRGPIFEGLPTLENHRGVAPYAAFLDMTLRYGVDDVFVGDGVIESLQVEWINTYLEEGIFTIPAVFEESAQALYGMTYTIRKDSPQSLMRLQESREYAHAGEIIQPQRTIPRVKGSITLDNLKYMRYSGEIQITKRDYPADERVNVIGYIPREYQLILELVPNAAKIRFVMAPNQDNG